MVNLETHRGSRNRTFIQSILRVQDHGVPGSEIHERFTDDIKESAIVDPHHLPSSSGWIRQRPQQVEDGGYPQRLSHRHDMSGRRMMVDRETEADPHLVQTSGLDLRVRIDIHSERLKSFG